MDSLLNALGIKVVTFLDATGTLISRFVGPFSVKVGSGMTATQVAANQIELTATGSGGGGTIKSWTAPFYMNGGTNCGSANGVKINLFSLGANLSTSKVTYRIQTTDASNNYSVGIYDGSGNLVAHTSPGTLPANDTVVQASWAEGTVALTPGNYFFAFTGQATTGNIYSEGSGTPVTLHLLSSQVVSQTSSGGLLPSSITVPALTGSAGSDNMLFILS